MYGVANSIASAHPAQAGKTAECLINRLEVTIAVLQERLVVISNLADRLTGSVPRNAEPDRAMPDAGCFSDHIAILCDKLDSLNSRLTDEVDRLNRFI